MVPVQLVAHRRHSNERFAMWARPPEAQLIQLQSTSFSQNVLSSFPVKMTAEEEVLPG